MQSSIKHIASAYLLLLLLLKLMALPVVCLEFRINQEYIAANLCENKDKPAMHCHGKCHLTKQMQKTADLPGQEQHKSNTISIGPDFFQEQPLVSLQYMAEPVVVIRTLFQDKRFLQGFTGAVFHPPSILS
ncbi:hypothetical protein [Parasegetibacter sp. NRK P23]|uniref:hypothetical protein n=1 Tax=Parasegetibacter sp. NRK P23 TaxID=2942999 RepID=UPI002042F495|nr:hypothetical protein [Parasegetibacter sp. NRK P23]MCM5528089.1 hypothetical protein [Parasegetibacter sp. NRK P23]